MARTPMSALISAAASLKALPSFARGIDDGGCTVDAGEEVDRVERERRRLAEREGAGVRLGDDGVALLEHGAAVVDVAAGERERAEARERQRRRRPHQRLGARVACSVTPAMDFPPPATARYRVSQPSTRERSPGVARSMNSWQSKCERDGSGLPAAWMKASLPSA